MSRDGGHIELDRAVDSIRVGRRHRTGFGDLDALADSIERDGLLQPITVTPDGILVCGARRLAAIKQLGWQHESQPSACRDEAGRVHASGRGIREDDDGKHPDGEQARGTPREPPDDAPTQPPDGQPDQRPTGELDDGEDDFAFVLIIFLPEIFLPMFGRVMALPFACTVGPIRVKLAQRRVPFAASFFRTVRGQNQDRHRGPDCSGAPATSPSMRVRTRRFVA